MRIKPDTIDQYSFYDYKPSMRDFNTATSMPGWVPELDKRRLAAYMLLASYVRNNSRSWLPKDLDEADVDGRREYGDAGTIVDTIVSSVMGETQKIHVRGAVDEDPAIPGAVDQQLILEDWAIKEHLMLKVLENERTATQLGDACYVLGWDSVKARPRLRIYDPGFYFPVIDPENDEDFPRTVHVAYEFERLENGQTVKYLRRISWSLVNIAEHYGIDPASAEANRVLPWELAPSPETCLMSDGEWRLSEIRNGLVDLSLEVANWKFFEEDLGFNFIPVVHMPNTVAEQDHFGTSSLARILQVIDDIVSTDTDLQAASATTGTPPIAISGASVPKDESGRISTYGPGTVLETGDGNATMIDTSNSLNALLELDKHLLSRMSVNGRIPESLLGRVKPNEVPSGIALTLSFTPHSNMVKEMRLVRNVKYTLLLKFVTRMFMLSGMVQEEFDCKLVLGSFLPADKQEASTLVTQLVRGEKPLISLQTAVEMLIRAGFPIEDAANEIRRIMADDFEGANRLFDATGDVNLVFQRLGLASTSLDQGGMAQEQILAELQPDEMVTE